MAKATAKKRKVIVESTGEAHINATFNNIIISLTNKKGEVISWSSAGKMGLEVLKRILLMQLKWQQKIVEK
jgi:small subunit ribosomal protein S11